MSAGGRLPFLDAMWAVAPTAIRMGFRSEIGLAVTRFPPMDWGEGEGGCQAVVAKGGPRLCAHCHIPDLVPCKPP